MAIAQKTPARPSQKSDVSARDALLDAASQLMIEMGTSEVSLHSIARKAGVSTPLFTYHFGSKEGLLVALIERDTAGSLAQLEELREMSLDPVLKMQFHISGIVRAYQRHPYLLSLLNLVLRESRNEASERLKRTVVMPLVEAQRAIVEDGMAAGKFRAIDTDQLYFAIVGACQYLFTSRVAFANLMDGKPGNPDFAREFATTVTDVLLNGIRKPEK